MPRVLLVDIDKQHAERIRGSLVFRAREVDVFADPKEAAARLQQARADYQVVILNVSNVLMPWINILANLQAACFQSGVFPSPLILCTSTIKQSFEFQLRIERMGARYVYEG
jgi:CheY-like chemotaxis protein